MTKLYLLDYSTDNKEVGNVYPQAELDASIVPHNIDWQDSTYWNWGDSNSVLHHEPKIPNLRLKKGAKKTDLINSNVVSYVFSEKLMNLIIQNKSNVNYQYFPLSLTDAQNKVDRYYIFIPYAPENLDIVDYSKTTIAIVEDLPSLFARYIISSIYPVTDKEDYINKRDYLLKKQKKHHSLFHDPTDFFMIYEGFLGRDAAKLEKGLNKLENPKYKKRRTRIFGMEKVISLITTALAKLAWMHGMEVSVASDYVPEWILPFEPLEEYGVPYKFLWEYYQQQGVHDWPYRPVHPELQA
jgi:hypothetical protein